MIFSLGAILIRPDRKGTETRNRIPARLRFRRLITI
jgi:hypothetical protein